VSSNITIQGIHQVTRKKSKWRILTSKWFLDIKFNYLFTLSIKIKLFWRHLNFLLFFMFYGRYIVWNYNIDIMLLLVWSTEWFQCCLCSEWIHEECSEADDVESYIRDFDLNNINFSNFYIIFSNFILISY